MNIEDLKKRTDVSVIDHLETVKKDKRKASSPQNGKRGGRPPLDINGIAQKVVEKYFVDEVGVTLKCYRYRWFLYNGAIYKPYDTEALSVKIIDTIKLMEENVTKNLVKNVMEALCSSDLCGISHSSTSEVFNIKTGEDYHDYLVFKNGSMIHAERYVKGIEGVIEASRDVFKTKCLNFNLDVDAGLSRKYSEYLSSSHEDETEIKNLNKFAGLCLTTNMKYNKLLCLYGPPGTG